MEPAATPSPDSPSGRSESSGRVREKLHRQRTSPRRLIADRVGRWVVTAGGMAIIASILGILIFILVEVWPLTRDAHVTRVLELPQSGAAGGEAILRAVVVDEHRTHVAGLTEGGTVVVRSLADGRVVSRTPLVATGESDERLSAVRATPHGVLSGVLPGGRLVAVPVDFEIAFEGGERRVVPDVGEPVIFELGDQVTSEVTGTSEHGPAYAVTLDDDGTGGTVAAQAADGRLVVVRRSVGRGFLDEEGAESVERWETPAAYDLSALVIDERARDLYGGTPGGELLWWPLGSNGPGEVQVVSAGEAGVTALSLLLGDRSLVVGQEDGVLSVWFPVEEEGRGAERLTLIRSFPRPAGSGAPIVAIAPSPRGKGFVAADAGGGLGLYHSTSHQTLWNGATGVSRPLALAYAPKADAAYLVGAREIAGFRIDAPHPEITWRTLFGEVWYEGYDQPATVWQSSSGTQDFEPKLSLTPLLVGTLKGTLYSLVLAIPLGIFGAMYLSQFMHPGYKRYIKPVIEIMAALPSVVLGFLAGLWLAPRLEQAMPALLLMGVFLPAAVLLAGSLWSLLPRRFRHAVPTGTEMFTFAVAIVLAAWGALALSPWFEAAAFGGSFQSWLLSSTGLPYDQRNAVVVGIAMGFAVIPIIFAISEDAFSNVPPNLVAGSLALGANRWQTVTRVVLPTASPGIFSAVMIGFGRAVGETMIVLMATGNTPIMSWNPFNGFRTLSANIAVEIPEAPQHGTLYRTLFLAALLLFVLTFVVNTVAELVRQRLRQRYSRL
jgi:phosphate transport system permease protein